MPIEFGKSTYLSIYNTDIDSADVKRRDKAQRRNSEYYHRNRLTFLERRNSGYFRKIGSDTYVSCLTHFPGTGQSHLGAKPKSPVDDKPESPSFKDEVDAELDDQHTSKVEVVLRRPLSAQFGPDRNEGKENELDVKTSQEDIHFEATIQNDNTVINEVNSDILSEPSNVELDESCTSTSEASPEKVNDVVSDSDFYVVDVISGGDKEKKTIESVEVNENFKEAVVISDVTSDEEKLSEEISQVNDRVGIHTGKNIRDSTDLLKEQIFDIISNIDESGEVQKISEELPAPTSVSIDLSTANTNNTSIDSNSLHNSSDNINSCENNSANVSADVTIPHISITSDNAGGDDVKDRKLDHGEHKIHHRYSREIAVHYTEDLRADLEALEKEEQVASTNLAVSNQEISNVNNTVEGDVKGTDSMSHDHTVNASIDTGNVSSGSVDQTESHNAKRYERAVSLNEQRRQFILGENRSNSVDSKRIGDTKPLIDEETIIPSVKSVQNEEPEELRFPDENGTEAQTESQNENIISDTPDKVESNGPADVEVSLDLNKNPDDSNVSKDKQDKLANDADILNGNSEGISEEETKTPPKKKRKGKQTCKCSLM